jgi:hypothetical protein
MHDPAFDFDALRAALRTDIQAYLDSYAAAHPADGPALAFCLYFDSGSGANGMVLPLAAARTAGVTLPDVASWFYYADHVEAPQSEATAELQEAYTETLYATADAAAAEALGEQFQAMIRQLLRQLSFERLPRTDDFIYFALGMDEELAGWQDTIPPPLRQKHFPA